MTKPSPRGRKNKSRSVLRAVLPLRWVNLPHHELYLRALNSMAPGSRERAKEDALRHGLSRRLREMKKADHAQYVEMECCRIVESLRAIRDEYRRYLKEKGCEPICDMQVSQHYLPHRGFDVLSRIGNSRVSSSAPSLVMRYMSSRKNPWPSTEAIGSKLIVVPCLSGPTGRPAIRFVVCTCQYGTFLRSDQESIACCASGVFADAR